MAGGRFKHWFTYFSCSCRYFLDNVAGWILELDRGKGLPFEGNFSEWLEARAKRLEGERKQQAGLQRLLDSELEFVRSKAKGQQKKGKARMRRYDELVSQVSQSRAPVQSSQHGELHRSPWITSKGVRMHHAVSSTLAACTMADMSPFTPT